MLVIKAPLGCAAGQTLTAWLLAITPATARIVVLVGNALCSGVDNSIGGIWPYILRRLHSAHAWGVVTLFEVFVAAVFVPSCESVDCFRGVTPWKVWNMPAWVATGIVGAMMADCAM